MYNHSQSKEVSMKLLLLAFLSAAMFSSPLFAQRFTQLWKIDGGSQPAFPNSGDVYRGAAFNPATSRYLVVTRASGLKVYSLNATTGATVDSLNTTGITGGTFALNDIEVTNEGVVYAANLCTNSGSDTTFKIYRWASESATPTVAYSGRPGTARVGDVFDVAGSGNGTVIYASGNAASSVIQRFTTANGVDFTLGAPIGIVGQEAGAGIAQVTPGGNAYISRFATGNKINLVNTSGTVLDSINSTASGASTGDLHYFALGAKRYIAVAPAGSTNNDPARLLDVTTSGTAATLVDSTGDLGNFANGNATGDVDMRIAGNIITLYVLIGNNGLAAYTIDLTPTAVANTTAPLSFDLAQNFPNPFNPTTNIEFSLPSSGKATLRVFDLLGREVATLVDGVLPQGNHRATFNASAIASGTYFYRLEFGPSQGAESVRMKRMVVMK
jgi:hypothetical protein